MMKADHTRESLAKSLEALLERHRSISEPGANPEDFQLFSFVPPENPQRVKLTLVSVSLMVHLFHLSGYRSAAVRHSSTQQPEGEK